MNRCVQLALVPRSAALVRATAQIRGLDLRPIASWRAFGGASAEQRPSDVTDKPNATSATEAHSFEEASGRTGGASDTPSSESMAAAERAKKAQRMWDLAVPERNWGITHPMIPVLVLVILALQWGIGSSAEEAESREGAEVERLKAEREARRLARARGATE
mmetsp:Transcript_116653/g.329960  ORF Transcript_116653/g.329960 Transcript_116653/m.329960 type:complete len:162 (-) Transcript_116653:108-593(-)